MADPEDKYLTAVAGYINQGYDLVAARRLARFDQAYEQYKKQTEKLCWSCLGKGDWPKPCLVCGKIKRGDPR